MLTWQKVETTTGGWTRKSCRKRAIRQKRSLQRRNIKEMEERIANQSCSNDQDSETPAQTTVPAADIASSSKTPAVARHERRVVRALAQLRSPYVDPENADPFYCSKEVCDIYDSVCQFSGPQKVTRRRAIHNDNSKPIINYDEFFINCNELANSMAPEKKMDSIVAEIAITSIRGSDPRPKRRIMPLLIATYFQNNCFTRNGIDKYFENKIQRLSRCESILFPTLDTKRDQRSQDTTRCWC